MSKLVPGDGPLRPRKALGQNFLRDPNLIRKIVAAVDPRPGDLVLEYGCGTGALTRPLVASGARVIGVEVDEDLLARLAADPALAGLELRSEGLEQLPPASVAEAAGVARLKLVGNLPYQLSSVALFAAVEDWHCVERVVFMLQREVAERILEAPGSRRYGILPALLQARFKVEKVLDAGPRAFFPSPEVKSRVLSPDAAGCAPRRRRRLAGLPGAGQDALPRAAQAARHPAEKVLRGGRGLSGRNGGPGRPLSDPASGNAEHRRAGPTGRPPASDALVNLSVRHALRSLVLAALLALVGLALPRQALAQMSEAAADSLREAVIAAFAAAGDSLTPAQADSILALDAGQPPAQPAGGRRRSSAGACVRSSRATPACWTAAST